MVGGKTWMINNKWEIMVLGVVWLGLKMEGFWWDHVFFPGLTKKKSLQIREDRQVKSDFVGPASCFYKMGNFNKSSKGVLV